MNDTLTKSKLTQYLERKEAKYPKMEKVVDVRPPQEIVQTGLRILARIISREAVRERQAKTDALKPDLPSSEASPAEVSIHV